MTQEFVSNPSNEANHPVSGGISHTAPSGREKLKHILIGYPKVVKSAIRNLHVRGYAETRLWSPLHPTANPNEVMSVLVRYVLRD